MIAYSRCGCPGSGCGDDQVADGEKTLSLAGLQSEGTASSAEWLGRDLILGWTVGHYQIADGGFTRSKKFATFPQNVLLRVAYT